MISSKKHSLLRTSVGIFVFSLAGIATSFAAPACDPDNGGIHLPPGFCAEVVADNLGAARHAVATANGDLYVALQGSSGTHSGVVALHDSKGDGRFDVKEYFWDRSATGIAIHEGYLYVASPLSVVRFKLTPGELKPSGEPEVVVSGFPTEQEHRDKGLTFDNHGNFYVNVGAPSNACQSQDRRKGIPGMDPCPILAKHGGVWEFKGDKLGQTQDTGVHFATGLRQFPALTWHDGAVIIVMNNRDQLDTLWPEHFTVQDNATRPAEPMYRAVLGSNFGWPYCVFDYIQQKLILNPEYGGDGKMVGRCAQYTLPIASYPAHWAPVDVAFYSGTQFPARYRGGAFIAFHGSWNRAPMPQAGYNVTFQPFAGGKPSGKFQVFASGFPGKEPLMNPADADARPDGVAQAPDGSLYITDSQKGKIWRVFYHGK